MGPRSWHKKWAVTSFATAILKGLPITVCGDGSANRDFLMVDDLREGMRLALEASLPRFTVFRLASGCEVFAAELARLLCETARKPDHPIERKDKRAGEVERNLASFDRARDALGFSAAYQLEDAPGDTGHCMASLASSRLVPRHDRALAALDRTSVLSIVVPAHLLKQNLERP